MNPLTPDLDQPPGLGDDGHLHPVQGKAVNLSLQLDGHLANLQRDRRLVLTVPDNDYRPGVRFTFKMKKDVDNIPSV